MSRLDLRARGELVYVMTAAAAEQVTGQDRAHLSLDIEVSALRTDAAPAVAGLRPGWEQMLDALDEFLRAEPVARQEA